MGNGKQGGSSGKSRSTWRQGQAAPPGWHADEKAWGEKRATVVWSRDQEEHKERNGESGQEHGLLGYPSVQEGILSRVFAFLGALSSVELLLQQRRGGGAGSLLAPTAST